MLNHPTLDKLQALRFTGMAKALTEQMAVPDIEDLSFEERLRAGTQSLSRWFYGALPAPAKITAGTTHCQRRRHLHQTADPTGQDRCVDTRRLGSIQVDG